MRRVLYTSCNQLVDVTKSIKLSAVEALEDDDDDDDDDDYFPCWPKFTLRKLVIIGCALVVQIACLRYH